MEPQHSSMSLPHEAIGITIDPVALIVQECITITSAMRRHPRWAQSSVSAILGGSAAGQDLTNQSLLGRSAVGKPLGPPTITRDGRLGSVSGPGGASASDDESSLASKWGLRTRKNRTSQDNPLLSAFARLRRDLAGCQNVLTIDAPTLLHPFLQVIRSSSTTAAITSLAITSITKFFSYNLITLQSPRVSLAVHLLNAAITNCRYEASNVTADEVALLRLLRLMETLMLRPEGRLLGDEDICNLMSTGLSMCCQSSHTEFLRRSAEMSMTAMCQVVFGRLKELDIEAIESPSQTRSRSNTVASLAAGSLSGDPKIESPVSERTKVNARLERVSLEAESRGSLEAASTLIGADGTVSEEPDEVRPYGLASIRELFRVLIDLLDPHKSSNTESMRIMALRVIDTALEVAGHSIAAQPRLAVLVEDDLCRHLFQLVRSENLTVLNSSLRVAGTLLATCRKLLKLQQELFLSYLVACLHPRVDIPREPGIDPVLYEDVPQAPKLVKPAPSQPSSGRSTPIPVKDRQKLGLEGGTRRPEAREAMVETIGTLIRLPNFMTQLFVNYDCEVDRQDLCEDMVGLLSRNAFPDAATWSTVNVPPLCLDSLLRFIQSMAERLDQEQPPDTAERIARLQAQRTRKKLIKKGAAKFNDDPKLGVAYLKNHGVIENEDDPVQVARFLKGTSRLSKKVLGDFITKKSNEKLLTAFIELFDFDNKRIDEALREMLATFRLPGEAPLIARIVEVFTKKYCASDVPEGIANDESAYILTYAIIMLNTDLHNPNVRGQKRMACEDFARNLRGTNDGKDFDIEYLQDVYDAIKQNEIILPEEHDNKHAFDYAWKELLMKTQDAGQLDPCLTNAYDAEIFNATWKPMIATLCYVFMSASDDAVFSRVVIGFDQCAQIAAKYGVQECFDRIVFSLSQICSLAAEIPPSTSLNTEVQAGQKKIMVSELAVRLGRDFRAQLSTVLLFRILKGNERCIKETWTYLVRILRNLFVNSLIKLPVFESKMSEMDSIPLQTPSQVIDRDGKLGESGLFSTFTSYLSSYAADDPPEPSEEELENTLSSVDCVKACHCEVFLSNVYKLSSEQIAALVEALMSQLPDEPSPVVVVKTERPMPVTARVNGHRGPKGPEYHPGSVFLLELATVLTVRDEQTLQATGESVTGALQNAVRDASNLHPLAASRIVLYLLDLLRFSYTYDFMRAPVVLHAISSFDDPVLDATAASVMKGLASCIAEPGPLRNEITTSPDYWSILQRLHQHKTEAVNVFEMLSSIAQSAPTSINSDNFEATVSLANEFVTAGSIGSMQEQRRDMAAKRGLKAKPAPPEQTDQVQRAIKAINIIYSLAPKVPNLIIQSHLERNEAWAAHWSPIFRSLSSQSINPCREIRYRAITTLQRTLLSEDLAITKEDQQHKEWTAIFGEVLFPLVVRILKPEVYQLDASGMAQTRLQTATLLCKIFLKYLDDLVSCDEMLSVWTQVLGLLDRMTNAGIATKDGEAMQEAVGEGVKNVILVMAGSGYLVPPSKIHEGDEKKAAQKIEVWNETGKRLERFLPGLLKELFPPAPPKVEHKEKVVEKHESQSVDGPGREGVDVPQDAAVPAAMAEVSEKTEVEAEAETAVDQK